VRFVRAEAGPTSVEYAVMLGLLIAIGGAAAIWLGRGVEKSQGRVSYARSTPSYAANTSSGGSRFLGHVAGNGDKNSALPWALLSLGVSAAIVGTLVVAYRMRERIGNSLTRRRVRQSLADVRGREAIPRIVRQTTRQPVVRLKRPDTSLIGRNSPDLHHMVRQRDSAEMLARDIGPGRILNGPGSAAAPATAPTVSVAG
jgi:hypothetical protein